MSEKPTGTLPALDFLREAERVLTPTMTECFSEETKNLRNVVLVIGFVLILLSLGVISAESKPVVIPLIGLEVTVTKGLTWLLIIVCSYFLIICAARSYTEWQLWRMKHQAPLLELKGISEQISAAQIEITRRRLAPLERLGALAESGTASSTGKEEWNRLFDGMDPHRDAEEWDQLKAMQDTLLEFLVHTKRSFLWRLWLEAVFPVAFGTVAIVWAAVAP
ncbi:MAG: hypothetical protein QNK31_06370 [Porticoccus sp.]|nr:hypothetical protein [Porticoccus sp.]